MGQCTSCLGGASPNWPTKTIYLLGVKDSGKTTLINQLKYGNLELAICCVDEKNRSLSTKQQIQSDFDGKQETIQLSCIQQIKTVIEAWDMINNVLPNIYRQAFHDCLNSIATSKSHNQEHDRDSISIPIEIGNMILYDYAGFTQLDEINDENVTKSMNYIRKYKYNDNSDDESKNRDEEEEDDDDDDNYGDMVIWDAIKIVWDNDKIKSLFNLHEMCPEYFEYIKKSCGIPHNALYFFERSNFDRICQMRPLGLKSMHNNGNRGFKNGGNKTDGPKLTHVGSDSDNEDEKPVNSHNNNMRGGGSGGAGENTGVTRYDLVMNYEATIWGPPTDTSSDYDIYTQTKSVAKHGVAINNNFNSTYFVVNGDEMKLEMIDCPGPKDIEKQKLKTINGKTGKNFKNSKSQSGVGDYNYNYNNNNNNNNYEEYLQWMKEVVFGNINYNNGSTKCIEHVFYFIPLSSCHSIRESMSLLTGIINILSEYIIINNDFETLKMRVLLTKVDVFEELLQSKFMRQEIIRIFEQLILSLGGSIRDRDFAYTTKNDGKDAYVDKSDDMNINIVGKSFGQLKYTMLNPNKDKYKDFDDYSSSDIYNQYSVENQEECVELTTKFLQEIIEEIVRKNGKNGKNSKNSKNSKDSNGGDLKALISTKVSWGEMIYSGQAKKMISDALRYDAKVLPKDTGRNVNYYDHRRTGLI